MKKIVYTFLCILIGMSIGIPLIYNDDNRLSVALVNGVKLYVYDYIQFIYTLNNIRSS